MDWSFWYNKQPPGRTTGNTFINNTDAYLNSYYKDVIAKANGYTTTSAETWLIDEGYCRKDSGKLTCDADPNSDIHNPDNYEEFTNNFNKFNLLTASVSDFYSIANTETMDYEGTVADDYLFTDDNVVTFINYLNAPSDSSSSAHAIPFSSLCAYAISGAVTMAMLLSLLRQSKNLISTWWSLQITVP